MELKYDMHGGMPTATRKIKDYNLYREKRIGNKSLLNCLLYVAIDSRQVLKGFEKRKMFDNVIWINVWSE